MTGARGRELDLDRVFAALADPTRRAILTALLDGEASVSDLAAPFDMSLAGVSKHLRILAQAGLVSQVRAGREKSCRLEPDAINAALIWMQGFGGFEGVDLDAVERILGELIGDEDGGDGSGEDTGDDVGDDAGTQGRAVDADRPSEADAGATETGSPARR